MDKVFGLEETPQTQTIKLTFVFKARDSYIILLIL